MDTQEAGIRHDYGFLRHLGGEETTPARLRVHLLFMPERASVESAAGFSFPLCGPSRAEWTSDSVYTALLEQAAEFSHYLGNLDFTDTLIRLWSDARVYLLPEALGLADQQLFMYWHAEPHVPPTYVYLHEDGISDAHAEAERAWAVTCTTMQSVIGTSRGRLDADYSPSKPPSKVSRVATALARRFAGSS